MIQVQVIIEQKESNNSFGVGVHILSREDATKFEADFAKVMEKVIQTRIVQELHLHFSYQIVIRLLLN